MSVETSRDAFLQALERLLSVPDAASPGINAVAREAGLNKVLIYRYFGSWDGLLDTFAKHVNPWRELRIETEAGLGADQWPDLSSYLKWLLRSYLGRLQASSLLQNLLRLSFVDRDPLQTALERDREDEGLALTQAVGTRFSGGPDQDSAAWIALLTGGLSWLVIAGSRAGRFNGLVFAGPDADGVSRLEAALNTWVDALTTKRGPSIL